MNKRSFNIPPAAIRTMTAAYNQFTVNGEPFTWRDYPEDFPISEIFDQVMHAMLCWHERHDTIEGVHALGHVMAWAGCGLDLISQDELVDDRPGLTNRKSRDSLEKNVEQLIAKAKGLIEQRREMQKEIDLLREALARKDEGPIPPDPQEMADRKAEYENACRAAVSLGEVNPEKGAPGIVHTEKIARAAREKPIVDDEERINPDRSEEKRKWYGTDEPRIDRAIRQGGWRACQCGQSVPIHEACRNPDCDLEGVMPGVLCKEPAPIAAAKLQGGWRICEGCGSKTPRVSQCGNTECMFHRTPVQICKHHDCGFVGPDVCWKEYPLPEQTAGKCERGTTHMAGLEED